MSFNLTSPYKPTGDQPEAIKQLLEGLNSQIPYQTLLGVTGSGKTFTIANVINQTNRPTLVLSHNKTLAAQLYSEFKALATTSSLLSGRRDVIVISSVSCLYGIGNPEDFTSNLIEIQRGMKLVRNLFLRTLVECMYTRNEIELNRGNFRVKGDTVDIFPAYADFILI